MLGKRAHLTLSNPVVGSSSSSSRGCATSSTPMLTRFRSPPEIPPPASGEPIREPVRNKHILRDYSNASQNNRKEKPKEASGPSLVVAAGGVQHWFLFTTTTWFFCASSNTHERKNAWHSRQQGKQATSTPRPSRVSGGQQEARGQPGN